MSVMSSEHGPGRRRFTYDQAAALMREFNAGGVTVAELADRHKVSWTAMRALLTGRTYTDIWVTVQREASSIVDWEEPPPRKHPGPSNTPGVVLDELVALLKAHPDRWAWVRTAKKKPNISWWHRRGLQAEMRKMDDGWRVYARWPSEGLQDTP